MFPDLSQTDMNAIVQTALGDGINWFDTAEMYGMGKSEQGLATALEVNETKDNDVLIATKVRFARGKGVNAEGLSRAHILTEVENSLRRLGTDYIDLYQTHMWDEVTPLDETLRALDDLVAQGKIPKRLVAQRSRQSMMPRAVSSSPSSQSL